MNEVSDLGARLDALADALTGPQMEAVMTELGVAAKKDMDAAVRADLGGDNRFSGWSRAPLVTGFEHTGYAAITLAPRNNGPFQVAEQGRMAGSTVVGRRRRKYTGRRVAWGRTRPKLTWSDGVDDIVQQTPDRALVAVIKLVRKVVL